MRNKLQKMKLKGRESNLKPPKKIWMVTRNKELSGKANKKILKCLRVIKYREEKDKIVL